MQVAKNKRILTYNQSILFCPGLVREFVSEVQFFMALALFIFAILKNIPSSEFVIETI